MSPAQPRVASAHELVQYCSSLRVATCYSLMGQLLPLLHHVTERGPYRGFIFDLESTGSFWRVHRIVDICMQDIYTGDVFETLVNPGMPISPEAAAIHGIRDSMVRGAPELPPMALALLLWLYQHCRAAGGARPVLIGHNIEVFDTLMLGASLAVMGCAYPPTWRYLDTYKLARRWLTQDQLREGLGPGGLGSQGRPSYGLQSLRQYFQLSAPGAAHRARPDVEVNLAVLQAMMARHTTSSDVNQALNSELLGSCSTSIAGRRALVDEEWQAKVAQHQAMTANEEQALEAAKEMQDDQHGPAFGLDPMPYAQYEVDVEHLAPKAAGRPKGKTRVARRATSTGPPDEAAPAAEGTELPASPQAGSGARRWQAPDPAAEVEAFLEAEELSTSPVSTSLADSAAVSTSLAGSAPVSTIQADSALGVSPEPEPTTNTASPTKPTAAPSRKQSIKGNMGLSDLGWQVAGLHFSSSSELWKGVVTPKQLEKLGSSSLDHVLSLLMHYPRGYTQHAQHIDPSLDEQHVVVPVTVSTSHVRSAGLGRSILHMKLELPVFALLDPQAAPANGQPPCINAGYFLIGPYAPRVLSQEQLRHPLGSSWVLRGKIKRGMQAGIWDCSSPELLAPDTFSPQHDAVITRYGAAKPLEPKDLGGPRGVVQRLLAALQGLPVSQDPLPPSAQLALRHLLAQDLEAPQEDNEQPRPNVPDWWTALQIVHQPELRHVAGARNIDEQIGALENTLPDMQAAPPSHSLTPFEAARKRLAFQEMFFMQQHLLHLRGRIRSGSHEAPPVNDLSCVEAALAALPFRLTGAQQRAVDEILQDLQGARPMYRLLQGDVGSGKTAVAFLAMLAVAGSGHQAALIVPSEVLAQQHFTQLQALMEAMPLATRAGLKSVALLTGSTKAKDKKVIDAGLASGEVRLVVGTHSLLFRDDFQALGLLVIDEQHKFGVKQKEKLSAVARRQIPHVLSMSATPIPRTMALVKFGHMLVSALDEMPPSRQPVATRLVPDTPEARSDMWEQLRADVRTGGRAFVVYPLREDSDSERLSDIRNAEQEFSELSGLLGQDGVECVLLHGKMKGAEKEQALQSFRDGSKPVMVCTVVVEVGVDVPEASTIIIEHADRFGLAQLHQLRGRVGRGTRPSQCLLVAPADNPAASARLQVMERSNNGFDIAEADMRMRGAGDLFGGGGKQSGGWDCSALCQEEIIKDARVLEVARRAAAESLGHTGPHAQAALAAHRFHTPEDVGDVLMGMAV